MKNLILGIFGLLFLIFHFVLVNIYVMPEEWAPDSLESISNEYVHPLFYQGWDIFAPVPRENYRLYYRYFSEGVWSNEISLEQEFKKYNHEGAKRIALKAAHYLTVDTRKYTQSVNGVKGYREVKSSHNYRRAFQICMTHSNKELGIQPDSLEMILERELIPKKGYKKLKQIRDYFGAQPCK